MSARSSTPDTRRAFSADSNPSLRRRACLVSLLVFVAALLAECFGCKTFTLIKDVDGLYDRDPREHAGARLIREIDTTELRRRGFDSLPFERILIDLLENARLLRSIQIVNGRHPERIKAALEGEHVGTIVHAGHRARV